LDDISGSGQTRAVHEICSGVPKSEQTHFEAKGAGHYGIFSGRRWREHVYPVVKDFILSHNAQAPKAAKAITAKPAQGDLALVAAPASKAVAKPSVAKAPPKRALAAKQ
jgi:poly(3-hydroxybutyrate) depolymerase